MSSEAVEDGARPTWWQRLPLAYAAVCKRSPNSARPFLVSVMFDDLAVVVIAFALFTPDPLILSAAVLCFHLSLWSIYEVGYFENDLVALRHEANGEVPQRFREFAPVFSERRAWIVAIVLGGIGAWLVALSDIMIFRREGWTPTQEAVLVLAVWLGALITLRALYQVYNQSDKMTRVHLYLPLQVTKYVFPALFLPLAPAAAALIFAQILRRWLPYIVYRLTGQAKDQMPIRLMRLVTFVLLWLLLLPSNMNAEFLAHGAGAAGFLLLRAGAQLDAQTRSIRDVREDEWVPANAQQFRPKRQLRPKRHVRVSS